MLLRRPEGLRERAYVLAGCLYEVAAVAAEHGLDNLAADLGDRAFRLDDWAAATTGDGES